MSDQVVNPTPAPAVDNNQPNEQPLILNKFKTQDDLIKAYQELEKKQSKPKTLVDPIPEGPPAPTVPEYDWDAVSKEFVENDGELSEDAYNASLAWLKANDKKMTDEKAKKTLDAYIAGQKALLTVQQQDVDKMLDETVGSRDNYAAMVQWASTNLTPEEIQAYDAAIAGGINHAKLAIEGLHAKYVKANGNPPAKLLSGDSSGSAATIIKFDSWKDYTKARSDKRYKTDKAYKQMVDNSLLKSDLS